MNENERDRILRLEMVTAQLEKVSCEFEKIVIDVKIMKDAARYRMIKEFIHYAITGILTAVTGKEIFFK